MDIKFLRHSATLALSIVTLVFTFVPEASFGKIKLFSKISDEANITLNRVFAFALIFVFSVVAVLIFMTARRKVKIKGSNYAIIVEYGDLFKKSDAKIVIQFDECFTTTIGSNPSDINPSSVCGQYLENNPLQPQEMTALINKAQLIPAKSKSKFQKKDRYDSGKIVPNGRYLLLSFAKLDENGLGILSCDEFLDCLSTLWKEIDKYYGQEDVYMSVLGSGCTRMNNTLLTQQELLNIIIRSYKLSTHKMKLPYQLHIVCKKRDDFSLNELDC